MQPRLGLVTLGVRDLAASRAFYERLGWRVSGASGGDIVFFQLGAMVLALFPRHELAADAQVADTPPGFPGLSLAQNYSGPDEVDAAFAAAVQAGATVLKVPCRATWGGYSGYLGDPDGFVWELAHNPFFALDHRGTLTLPA